MVKASETGGVKPMTIQGRLVRQRERLVGMTDEERAFRKQFLKDQVLAHNEPKVVPELKRELTNPIRRFYRYPLDRVQSMLEPVMGQSKAYAVRYLSGKVLMGIAGVYYCAYYFKYNRHDWTRKGGWHVFSSREAVLPGHPEYPKLSDKTKPSDYASKGFENCKLNL